MDEREKREQILGELSIEFEIIVSEILSATKFEPLLALLFQSPAGEWLSIVEACFEIGDLATARRMADLDEEIARANETQGAWTSYVTWLNSPDDDGYAIVLFRTYPLMFSNMADYNLDYFWERYEQK